MSATSGSRSPRRRFLLIGLGALAVVALLAVLILPRLLDVENYRGSVEQALQKATGWDAELGEMDLSLFPGIALEVSPASLAAPGDGSRLDAILISGGGALLLGKYISEAFVHASIVDEPVYANARGFSNFAQRFQGYDKGHTGV